MAKKKSDQDTGSDLQRVISFRAPDTVHGALKQIVGRLEMIQTKVDGRVPFERDILTWLVAELHEQGPDKWPDRIANAHARFVEFQAKYGSKDS